MNIFKKIKKAFFKEEEVKEYKKRRPQITKYKRNKLIILAKENRYSQNEMSDMLDICPTTTSRILNSNRTPNESQEYKKPMDLTKDEIFRIKKLVNTGKYTQSHIAKLFKVATSTVSKVINDQVSTKQKKQNTSAKVVEKPKYIEMHEIKKGHKIEMCHVSDEGLLILSEVWLVLESKTGITIYTKDASEILNKESK